MYYFTDSIELRFSNWISKRSHASSLFGFLLCEAMHFSFGFKFHCCIFNVCVSTFHHRGCSLQMQSTKCSCPKLERELLFVYLISAVPTVYHWLLDLEITIYPELLETRLIILHRVLREPGNRTHLCHFVRKTFDISEVKELAK